MRRLLAIWALSCAVVLTGGCAAARLSLEKRELDVQTRTSQAVFLTPVGHAKPLLYLDVRSGVMEFERQLFRTFVEDELVNNGSAYQLTDNPNDADFHLSALIFNLEKAAPSAAELALKEGYGGPSISNSVGALMNFANDSDDALKVFAAAIVIGAVESVINATVKDVRYILVSDVEVREALPPGVTAKEQTTINQTVSDAGNAILITEEVNDHVKFRTRIVTTANKANLALGEAKELMFKQTAHAIAGIFAADAMEPTHDHQPDGALQQ